MDLFELTPGQREFYDRDLEKRNLAIDANKSLSEKQWVKKRQAARSAAFRAAKKHYEPKHYEPKKRSLREKIHGYKALARHHLRKLDIGVPKPKRRKKKKSSHRAKRRGRR